MSASATARVMEQLQGELIPPQTVTSGRQRSPRPSAVKGIVRGRKTMQ